jgi:hypothetical protein
LLGEARIGGPHRDLTANAGTFGFDLRRGAPRGLPAISRSTRGVVTDSFVPGSDEHLERLAD